MTKLLTDSQSAYKKSKSVLKYKESKSIDIPSFVAGGKNIGCDLL
jgi:hypothetical protein